MVVGSPESVVEGGAYLARDLEAANEDSATLPNFSPGVTYRAVIDVLCGVARTCPFYWSSLTALFRGPNCRTDRIFALLPELQYILDGAPNIRELCSDVIIAPTCRLQQEYDISNIVCISTCIFVPIRIGLTVA
ncbi:hypothetical protein J6590_093491 [Homalodisca vitripennis]|nr:hypothetical protein J6590_093491 [Homalodisca vitripennis]